MEDLNLNMKVSFFFCLSEQDKKKAKAEGKECHAKTMKSKNSS